MSDVAQNHANGAPTLTGACFGVDYKAFLAWQSLGHPAPTKNLFAMAALRSADGAYMLGEMAPWTANAGQIYFPCGTPDLNDLVGEALDLEGSALRELKEETGLAAADVTLAADWTIVFDGARVACMKDMRSPLTAAELIARAAAFIAQDKNPELTRLVPVFGADDICDQMPGFMCVYLAHAFAAAQG
jgi:8-oxo-dGTP pyrophosphatase MutT (NUDIX family)